MVVSGEGGSCECASCGSRCPGRFAGCAAVVAVPGRVPPSAPAWSRPGAEHTSTAVATNGNGRASQVSTFDFAAVQADLAEVRKTLFSLSGRAAEEVSDTTSPLFDTVETLARQLLHRDERLIGAFVAFAQRQVELGAQVEKLTATVEALVATAGLEKGANLPVALRRLLERRL